MMLTESHHPELTYCHKKLCYIPQYPETVTAECLKVLVLLLRYIILSHQDWVKIGYQDLMSIAHLRHLIVSLYTTYLLTYTKIFKDCIHRLIAYSHSQ